MDALSTTSAKLWARQDQHEGDRLRLFSAVHAHVGDVRVLYPGSFVDVAPSFVFSDVVYVEADKRAARFFADAGVDALVAEYNEQAGSRAFIHSDYTDDLDLADESFELLVSLYAGFISMACTRYLAVGGYLLVNPSHGDAALASLDDRYRLSAVVLARAGDYRVSIDGVDEYMVPKRPEQLTRDRVLESMQGVAYTKPAFAYLFERIG